MQADQAPRIAAGPYPALVWQIGLLVAAAIIFLAAYSLYRAGRLQARGLQVAILIIAALLILVALYFGYWDIAESAD